MFHRRRSRALFRTSRTETSTTYDCRNARSSDAHRLSMIAVRAGRTVFRVTPYNNIMVGGAKSRRGRNARSRRAIYRRTRTSVVSTDNRYDAQPHTVTRARAIDRYDAQPHTVTQSSESIDRYTTKTTDIVAQLPTTIAPSSSWENIPLLSQDEIIHWLRLASDQLNRENIQLRSQLLHENKMRLNADRVNETLRSIIAIQMTMVAANKK